MIRLKSLFFNQKNNANSFLSSNGTFIKVKPSEQHVNVARQLSDNVDDPLYDIFNRGYMRVTYKNNILYVNNPLKFPNEIQLKKLKELALNAEFDSIVYDNDNDKEQIIWSKK